MSNLWGETMKYNTEYRNSMYVDLSEIKKIDEDTLEVIVEINVPISILKHFLLINAHKDNDDIRFDCCEGKLPHVEGVTSVTMWMNTKTAKIYKIASGKPSVIDVIHYCEVRS